MKTKITKDDQNLIDRIAQRTCDLLESHDNLPCKTRALSYAMINVDLTITHERIVPLRLADMLHGPDFDLIHDVFGIRRHIDIGWRRKPRLNGAFLPRYAKV